MLTRLLSSAAVHAGTCALAVCTLASLAGCLATDNPDFRNPETPTGWGSSVGQGDRGTGAFQQGSSTERNPMDSTVR